MTHSVVFYRKDFVNPRSGESDDRIILFYGEENFRFFLFRDSKGGVRHFIDTEIVPFLVKEGYYPKGEHVPNQAYYRWLNEEGIVAVPLLPPTNRKDEDFL